MEQVDLDYIQALMGQPWAKQGLNCWVLVAQVQRHVFHREIPMGDAVSPRAREERIALLGRDPEPFGWQEVPRPVHGCVVRMHQKFEPPEDLQHAGVYLDLEGGLVLHTDKWHGVVLDTFAQLEQLRLWKARFFVPIERKDDGR